MDSIRRSIDAVRSRRNSASSSSSDTVQAPARRSSLKGSRRSAAEDASGSPTSASTSAFRPGLDRIESESSAVAPPPTPAPAPSTRSPFVRNDLSSSAIALQSIDTTAGPSRERLECTPGSRGHALSAASREIKPGETVTHETTVLKPVFQDHHYTHVTENVARHTELERHVHHVQHYRQVINDQQETHLERSIQLASPVRHVTTHPPVYHEPITHKLVAVPADAQLAFAEHIQPIASRPVAGASTAAHASLSDRPAPASTAAA